MINFSNWFTYRCLDSKQGKWNACKVKVKKVKKKPHMCIDKIEQETFNAFGTSVARLGSTYLLDKTIYIVYIHDISVRTLFAPV